MTHPALDAFGDLNAAAADPHVAGCPRCRAELAAQQEVRAVLAGLPDPGPMPPDVLDRIETTLRRLALAEPLRGGASGPERPSAAADTVVPLQRMRSAPRRHPLLAVAAAAALIAGGGYGLTQVLPGQSAGTSAAGGAKASIGARSANPSAGADAGAAVRTIASGRNYTRSALAAQVDQTLAGSTRAALAAPAGPLATAQGLAGCIAALGAGDATPLLVDVARFEGQPAAVLVLPASGGGREIWVVSTTCRAGQDGTRFFLTTR